MRALYHIDSSIGQLARVIERLPEYHYDLYILSDHGQTPTRNFRQVSGGESLESVVRAALGGAPTSGPWSHPPPPEPPRPPPPPPRYPAAAPLPPPPRPPHTAATRPARPRSSPG